MTHGRRNAMAQAAVLVLLACLNADLAALAGNDRPPSDKCYYLADRVERWNCFLAVAGKPPAASDEILKPREPSLDIPNMRKQAERPKVISPAFRGDDASIKSKSSRWKQAQGTDKFSDAPRYQANLEGTPVRGLYEARPELIIGCHDRSLFLGIDWKMYIGSERPYTRWRADKGEVEIINFRQTTDAHLAVIDDELARAKMNNLRSSKILLVGMTVPSMGQIDTEFVLEGIHKIVDAADKICRR